VRRLLSPHDAFLLAQSRRLVGLALRHRLATIYAFRESAKAGGSLSSSGSLTQAFRQRAADLQQVIRFEMIPNLRTGKALGPNAPNTLLVIADEVIE
jgi:hypothetical protein